MRFAAMAREIERKTKSNLMGIPLSRALPKFFVNLFSLSKAILYTKATPGIFPLHGTVDTGDLASAAFQASGKLDRHLSLLMKGVKICRARVDAKPFLAYVADFLVQSDMRFLVVFKSIESQFFSNLHSAASQQSNT